MPDDVLNAFPFFPRHRAVPPLTLRQPACGRCGRALWPDVTVPGRPPVWACPFCGTPEGRFWHPHHGRRCPHGYPWPLLRDTPARLFICY
ncbi:MULTISPECIES: hypothetical protein [Streptomyces]|uniref:Uncharacterized protein n=2 Tax=Streptomyces TaxID=1883 RepID=A0A286DZH9_9ACTN|nr:MULTISPECIES: hypothetical protein [Streptomyces]TNM30749.1 hypothetical protein FH715_12240 [Streptomyces sedi]SOD64020.1 hypothetical protein SAMN06297387_113179 [Streptomyces zhaozhouensis]